MSKKNIPSFALYALVFLFSLISFVSPLAAADAPPKEVVKESKKKPSRPERVVRRNNGMEPLRKLTTLEVYRNTTLLKKTIKDLDAYRIMLKYLVAEHHEDSQRLLLLEEADNYIDRNVDPLIENNLNYNAETIKLVATLKFYKAFVYFEAEKYDRYQEILKDMKKIHGNEFLGIQISPFGEKYKTIGDAVKNLKGMIL